MRKKIKIGLDFDGVVAYNPFRLIRAPIKWFKREMLGIRKLTFFVPKNNWERLMWTIIHESSIFPAKGVDLLKELAEDPNIEFHLITARFGFLKNNLYHWLESNDLKKIFRTINVNDKLEQPHVYKLKMVEQLKLDVFVEDNLDIVEYLNGKSKTKIYWIYNFMDAKHKYPTKFPYLKKALREVFPEEATYGVRGKVEPALAKK